MQHAQGKATRKTTGVEAVAWRPAHPTSGRRSGRSVAAPSTCRSLRMVQARLCHTEVLPGGCASGQAFSTQAPWLDPRAHAGCPSTWEIIALA